MIIKLQKIHLHINISFRVQQYSHKCIDLTCNDKKRVKKEINNLIKNLIKELNNKQIKVS